MNDRSDSHRPRSGQSDPGEPRIGKSRPAKEPCSCPPGCCGPEGVDRRRFIQIAGAGAGAAAMSAAHTVNAVAGPFLEEDTVDHFIPKDKKLNPDWVKTLFDRGSRTWYEGGDLETIGMPVGGICAGQVYLSGDGRLLYWDIFNQNINSGYGQVNYKEGRRPTEMVVKVRQFQEAPHVDQGFAVRVRSGGRTLVRSLDSGGFKRVRFCGEYPLGFVEYEDEDFPVTVKLEAFSPFIPLNAADSALPATILNYTVRNTSSEAAAVTLAGWLENAVGLHSAEVLGEDLVRFNRRAAPGGATAVVGSARRRPPDPKKPDRPPEVFADFEGRNYGPWTVEGEAFGEAPAEGTLPEQQAVSGFKGKGLVNTYLGKDGPLGKLVSPAFTIERPFITFLIGGGGHEKETCINLVVDGEVVRTATGRNNEKLEPHNWSVEDLAGKEARIEIVDAASGGWGHINIDQIEFRDKPLGREIGELEAQPDYGTMAVAVLDNGGGEPAGSATVDGTAGETGVLASLSLPDGPAAEVLFDGDGLAFDGAAGESGGGGAPRAAKGPFEKPAGQRLRGAVGRTVTLTPGEEQIITFVVSWCMPNLLRDERPVGNHYATRFVSAADVTGYIAKHLGRLARETRLWHDTFYDSTLPWWLLDRLHSTVGNLATNTCQWWGDGRFWAYEGCGCCHGTCGHVWNYEHAMARLFPELERSVREMQDFAPGIGFVAETGEIRFRGEGWGIWAGDSQGGYILKAYREHLCSPDDTFLHRNWKNIKKAVQFLIEQDGNADGLLEGKQHNTYDIDYYGPNTMVGSLYLGALRAAEEMARIVDDGAFAKTCRRIFEAGRDNSMKRLFNGEYFIQEVDLKKHPEWQYGDGCLADQLFGQGWAHQVGLGYLYPREAVLKALESIWAYCWAPDIGIQNEKHKPERWFAYPGEAGLFTCTWPKSKHLGPKSTRYRDEVWTGIEYQVANHMAFEGMLTETLAVCRAIHERYHPAKRNPFNEIECGDHYARALASWGVLISLAGFEYDGPGGTVAMAPRITPGAFRSVFTAAEGWGTMAQERAGGVQRNTFKVAWGKLRVRELAFTLPRGAEAKEVRLNGRPAEAAIDRNGDRLTIRLPRKRVLAAGDVFDVEISTG